MFKFVLFSVGVALFTAPFQLHAQDEHVVVYDDNGHRVVDKFSYSSDGWPDRVSHEEFENVISFESAATPPVNAAKKSNELLGKGHVVDNLDLWPATNSWSTDWEMEYSKWVAENFNADFFVQANFPTVCSDVAYALRWIFAREHGLPAANRLSTGELFTNRSLRDQWRKLPTDKIWYKDQRFVAALTYLTHNTYTHTLWDDSYTVPIAIGPLAPGAYHINKDGGYGHTMIVYKVSSDPNEVPLVTLSSTTPRAIRPLTEYMYSEEKSLIKPLALFRMRWPEIHNGKMDLVKAEAMPWYSNEQSQPDFVKAPRTQFWEEVFYRLNPDLDFSVVVKVLRDQIERQFLARVPIVEQGLIACRKENCRLGTSGWEDWSTVSRDERLSINIAVFDKFLTHVSNQIAVTDSLSESFLTIEGHAFTLATAMDQWRQYKYTSDPAHTIAMRWGLAPPPVPAPKGKK